jgi:hypothetical protein
MGSTARRITGRLRTTLLSPRRVSVERFVRNDSSLSVFYTTRRKQGGSQSASDASRGAAHSAGSSLRRYNEASQVQPRCTDANLNLLNGQHRATHHWQTANHPAFIFMCMIGGGHFAAMLVSLAPEIHRKQGGVEDRQALYRRKLEPAEWAAPRDASLADCEPPCFRRVVYRWKGMIDTAELLFVRATGKTNRKTLFGQYDGQVLRLIPFQSDKTSLISFSSAASLYRRKLEPAEWAAPRSKDSFRSI